MSDNYEWPTARYDSNGNFISPYIEPRMSKLILPPPKRDPNARLRSYVQTDMMADQLSRYIQGILDDEGQIEAVFLQIGPFGVCLRYSVAYKAFQERCCEVLT